MARVHVVEAGDTLVSIGEACGIPWRKIYDHPENEELRAARPNPNVLSPGDKVIIPDRESKTLEVATGRVHVFRRLTARQYFSIHLYDEQGRPFAGNRYELRVESETFEGKTGSDGLVSHVVPADARTGELEMWHSGDDPEDSFVWQVRIGELDPIDDVSGTQGRLNNLGFEAGRASGEWNDQTESALEDFQRRRGLATTGTLDDPTRAALLELQRQN